MTDPATLTAMAARAMIEAGDLTAASLMRACLDRAAARDAAVRAWSWRDPEAAMAAAEAADRDRADGASGPLLGLPLAVKDIMATAEGTTTYNSPLYEDHRAGGDADCVAIARAAGAVLMGKTVTHEFAGGGRLPQTRNPHDPEFSPGGSSSGSAAAVADRQVPLALGSQTAGSVIRPASFCGVAGFKPSHGRVPLDGVKSFAPSLDTLGWFARDAADLALLAEAYGILRGDLQPVPADRIGRIAVYHPPEWAEAEDDTVTAMGLAQERLRAAGLPVSPLRLDDPRFTALAAHQHRVLRVEGGLARRREAALFGDALHPDFRALMDEADDGDPQAYLEALDTMAALRPLFDAALGANEVVLCPAALGPAPPLTAQSTGDPLFNRMWTALHVPAVALPCHVSETGLPVGVQLVARRWNDAALLGMAATLAPILAPAG